MTGYVAVCTHQNHSSADFTIGDSKVKMCVVQEERRATSRYSPLEVRSLLLV